MANVDIELSVPGASLFSSGIPELVHVNGSAGSGGEIAYDGYAFDQTTQEALYWTFNAARYGSGDIDVILDFYANLTSGTCVWGARLGAVTASTDSASVVAKSTSTEATGSATTFASTANRLYRQTVTITAKDSLAADDRVFLRVCRRVDSDTGAGDVVLVGCCVRYSDV